MVLRRCVLFCLCFFTLSGGSLSAADSGLLNGSFDFSTFYETKSTEIEPVKTILIPEVESVQPGESFWVALKVEVESGWHTYWKNPGDTGVACSVDWFLPNGFEIVSCHWPTPERYTDGAVSYFGYQGEFVLLTQLKAPRDLQEKEVSIEGTLRWVACNQETCLPGDSDVSVVLPVRTSVARVQRQNQELFEEARTRLPQEDWTISAQRVHPGQIELHLVPPSPDHGAILTADFLPEPHSVVDYHLVPSIVSTAGSGFRLVLPEMTERLPSANPNELHGLVLVKRGTQEQSVQQAITVHVPVETIASTALPLDETLLIACLFAFLGGVILNLMPCVLPVISVKTLQLVKMAGESRRSIFKHGLAFVAGVLISFWILAGILLALQAYGESVGWGFQLQEPLFVGFLAAILLVFGLSLFGLFEFGTLFASWAGQKESQAHREGGLPAAFFGGVLATAVATPCTGPFLGTAVGLAVTLPPLASLTIFTFIGLGMSFPYLLLTAFPSLIRWLPRPGGWMVRFKQFMGFLMLGTVLWLTWVFAFQTGVVGVGVLLTSYFILALGCWIYGSWGTVLYSQRTKLVSGLFTILLLICGGYLIVAAAQTDSTLPQEPFAHGWTPYSKATFDQLRAEGKPIFIDFTAKWCLICQANHYVLEMDRVREQFQQNGVVKILADLTNHDPAISEELRKHGRSGVPLYLLYLPHLEEPFILPQVLTPEIVIGYLEKMSNDA